MSTTETSRRLTAQTEAVSLGLRVLGRIAGTPLQKLILDRQRSDFTSPSLSPDQRLTEFVALCHLLLELGPGGSGPTISA